MRGSFCKNLRWRNVMRNITSVLEDIKTGKLDESLLDIYVDNSLLSYQKKRYIDAIMTFKKEFGEEDISIFSAPGRSEISGNHTDHQKGQVLVAAVNLDAIAVVHKSEQKVVEIISDGYDKIVISLDNLKPKKEEEGTTISLVKGVLGELSQRGYTVGGFKAYITSDVLIGAGISSSAAFETLIGTIVSGLYNQMTISPVEIAIVGQKAENVYFGKPCGLMDQMASSVGNLVYIDFADTDNPLIKKIECDFENFGYSLCITDTKSSHADCTSEYAAVPEEMKKVAAVFGKNVLKEVSKEEILANIEKIRMAAGDRAVLRSLHFVTENERVNKATESLNKGDFEGFLEVIKASGNSSFKYLQNVYMNTDIQHQNVSVALALSEIILGENGVSRVHGGGFAGTIQAFVKNEAVSNYQEFMNKTFGEGACNIYMIRKYGGIKVV